MKQVYHKKINSTTNISVWKVNWGLEKLRNIYSLEEKKELKLFTFKSQKREIEVLAEHFILQQLLKKKVRLQHLPSGKPFIKDASHLSISHSHGYIAIALGEINLGIDIEKPTGKIVKLSKRFLSKKEKKAFDLNPSKEFACKLWSAKESILKSEGNKNIDFSKDIEIDCSHLTKGYTLQGTYFIHYQTIEYMILTSVIKKD